ncbi:MAG: Yip1 family protein [Propionivibrio sp.]
MNPMMFPKMLTSHAEGWDWLMRIHPSVARMFLAYVVPMSIIPPAMIIYASRTYTDIPLLEISEQKALFIAIVFFITELVVVPIMGRVVQSIGNVADAHPPYHDAFALAAVVPTPLWLAPLALFIPNLYVVILAMLFALGASAALIYQGVDRVFDLADEGKTLLVAGAVFAAGLVAWVAMTGLAFVTWGSALT